MTVSDVSALRKSVHVACSPERAFETFTTGIGRWWPLHRHSVLDDAATVVFEARAGGRIYERSERGEEATWGEVVAWEPPARVVYSWNPTNRPTSTEVEVRFIAEGDGTRVDLEHRGWERLADGAQARPSYDTGWDGVLTRYADAARGRDAASV